MKITHFTHPSSILFFFSQNRQAIDFFFTDLLRAMSRTVTFGSRLLVDMGSFPKDLQREIRLREKVHFGRVFRMVRGFWAIWRRTVFGVQVDV